MNEANNERMFSVQDELRYNYIMSAKLSPDGRQVVYSVKMNDLEKGKTFSHLFLLDLESREKKQLTFGETTNTNPEWSPDGKYISFLSNSAGSPQVFLLPLEGGELRQFTSLFQGVFGGPHWAPDGKTIAFTAFTFDPRAMPPDPTRPYRITRSFYRYDGVGYLGTYACDIFLQAVESQTPRQLTDGKNIVVNMHWSPDGRRILYQEFLNESKRFEILKQTIKIVDLEGNTKEVLGLEWGYISTATWSADGQYIVFGGKTADKPILGSKFDVWTFDLSSGRTECRTRGFKYGNTYMFGEILVFDDNHVLIDVPREGMGEVYRVALSGEESVEPVLQGKRSIRLFDIGKETVLFNNSVPVNPSELAIADRQGSNECILTDINQSWFVGIDLPRVENLRFRSFDGVEVEGWILLPAAGKGPYPTILYNHGGPHMDFGYFHWSDFMMLAGAGYAV